MQANPILTSRPAVYPFGELVILTHIKNYTIKSVPLMMFIRSKYAPEIMGNDAIVQVFDAEKREGFEEPPPETYKLQIFCLKSEPELSSGERPVKIENAEIFCAFDGKHFAEFEYREKKPNAARELNISNFSDVFVQPLNAETNRVIADYVSRSALTAEEHSGLIGPNKVRVDVWECPSALLQHLLADRKSLKLAFKLFGWKTINDPLEEIALPEENGK